MPGSPGGAGGGGPRAVTLLIRVDAQRHQRDHPGGDQQPRPRRQAGTAAVVGAAGGSDDDGTGGALRCRPAARRGGGRRDGGRLGLGFRRDGRGRLGLRGRRRALADRRGLALRGGRVVRGRLGLRGGRGLRVVRVVLSAASVAVASCGWPSRTSKGSKATARIWSRSPAAPPRRCLRSRRIRPILRRTRPGTRWRGGQRRSRLSVTRPSRATIWVLHRRRVTHIG